ncbi:hypothetical protein CXB51_023813 [Gossypium anomalum]|uniref:CHCH domain-containing protein n=1 Tax=Gossypium anomalum TaxID=47600 RepID=A0A8J5YTV1_9ROSI|nr:hypothetical protein CXB51_023813 [Gossypium anomalum]
MKVETQHNIGANSRILSKYYNPSSPLYYFTLGSFLIGSERSYLSSEMANVVDVAGEPIPTSSVLMAAAKHIEINCMSENVEFLKCKKKDPNPEKCLDKGRQATRCALGLLKELYQRCKDPMEGYVGCMYYHTNEFDLCRKQQQAFEKACPLE